MKATEVTAGLAESNGSLLPGLWRDSLHVTFGLTACTPGSAPGPTLANVYGKTLPLPFTFLLGQRECGLTDVGGAVRNLPGVAHVVVVLPAQVYTHTSISSQKCDSKTPSRSGV